MKIRTIDEILESFGCDDLVHINDCRAACILFAKQFIELAAEKARIDYTDKDEYVYKGKRDENMLDAQHFGDGRDGDVLAFIDKQSILEIKQLIK